MNSYSKDQKITCERLYKLQSPPLLECVEVVSVEMLGEFHFSQNIQICGVRIDFGNLPSIFGGRVESRLGPIRLQVSRISQEKNCSKDIFNELGECAEITLCGMFSFLKTQNKGSYLFFIKDDNAIVWLISAYRWTEDISLYAFPINYQNEWEVDRIVVSLKKT